MNEGARAEEGPGPVAEDGAGTWIVVFGAAVWPGGRPSPTLAARIEAAAALARSLPGARLVVTGGVGRHGPAEAEVMRAGLVARGIDAARILDEPTARDTYQSALRVRELLAGRADVARLVVVSSAYHLRRCRLLLRLAGLPAEAAAPTPGSEARRVGRGRWLWMRLREWPALPYDAALMLLARRAWRRFGGSRTGRG